ncbi:MAG: hypothetical protein JXB07_13530 [Anaerolineae bacterium]|nr:hypothetical protein [Anaerolineae bacterium]
MKHTHFGFGIAGAGPFPSTFHILCVTLTFAPDWRVLLLAGYEATH